MALSGEIAGLVQAYSRFDTYEKWAIYPVASLPGRDRQSRSGFDGRTGKIRDSPSSLWTEPNFPD